MVKELVSTVEYEFVVFVTTNNAELFVMPSRLKSHIILVQDRLQCVARLNCLVSVKAPNVHLWLARVVPSCFRSPSLTFPWYFRSVLNTFLDQYCMAYVVCISPHHMRVHVISSIFFKFGDLFGSLRHSRCPSYN